MNFFDKISQLFSSESKSAASGSELTIYAPERVGLSMGNRNKITSATAASAYTAHELVYSCINKIADVMNDAEIIVEKKGKDDKWEPVAGHLLTTIFKRPNPYESGKDFRRLMVQSEQSTAIFYAEMIRSGAGLVVEMYPLNPARVAPKLNEAKTGVAFYEYTSGGGKKKIIKTENMLVRRRVDLVNRFFGLSPLEVALKSINSDLGLTDYVDAFFESDGTPSGILKILNANLSDTKKEEIAARWRNKYSRGGSSQKGIAVLDQNADFQKIGANLGELASESLSDRFESRICSVFGVSPNLVGALVGLKHATNNATAKSNLRDFWDNKISPELTSLREWLTWFVLPEFEEIELIKAEKIRVGFDVSQAAFLQEDLDKVHARASLAFIRGAVTLNEYRQMINIPPDPHGDYYYRISSYTPILPEQAAEQAKLGLTSKLFTTPGVVEEGTNIAPAAASTDGEPAPAKQLTADTEKKTLIYDGLELSREPKGVELLINLKGMVTDGETEKQKAIKVLTAFRTDLINQVTEQIETFRAAEIYKLTLEPNVKTKKAVLKLLQTAYKKGRAQVIGDINAQKTAKNLTLLETKDLNDFEDSDEEIAQLSDLAISRIINEIQSRAINIFTALTALGGYTLEKLKEKLEGESIKFLEQQAGNSVNAAISIGRADEIENQKDEWKYVEYSAILDRFTCDTCSDADGQTADDIADLPDAPNPDCDGMGNCRCFIVAVVE